MRSDDEYGGGSFCQSSTLFSYSREDQNKRDCYYYLRELGRQLGIVMEVGLRRVQAAGHRLHGEKVEG